uniref:Reverse transcriptase domain-containing protein n=1 Tax=Tanacetum cinerariifolium TaxID=118510 RepID=A0A699HR45_TANCI|nr:reverse transcriptase domain-containing protein [Tanacetum cinerariifolium]
MSMGPQEGPTEPAQLTQTTPSLAFIKENIDVLRTMIKEHDQQAKAKATSKKLANDESESKATPEEKEPGPGKKIRTKEDSFKELSQKFLEELSQQKGYVKDPMEIHGIKRIMNEGLQAFMDRFKSESSHIKGIAPMLRISAFMHGNGNPKLAKKLNDKIPKTVPLVRDGPEVRKGLGEETVQGSSERTWEHVPLYSRRESFTPLTKTPKDTSHGRCELPTTAAADRDPRKAESERIL